MEFDDFKLSNKYQSTLLRAKEVATQKNITVYIVAPCNNKEGGKGWGISRYSRHEREIYEKIRAEEVSKLKPRSSFIYTSPYADETQQERELREWRDEQDAEYTRLWLHDNPGLRELYYPSYYPATIGPDYD